MSTKTIYLIIIGVLAAALIFSSFKYTGPSIRTRSNYKKYIKQLDVRLEEIRLANSTQLPLTTEIGEAYMKSFRDNNPGQPNGIVLTKDMVDFFKTYLDENDGKSIALGFGRFDQKMLDGLGLVDPELLKHKDKDNKNTLIIGVMEKGGVQIQSFETDTKTARAGTAKFYDDWNSSFP